MSAYVGGVLDVSFIVISSLITIILPVAQSFNLTLIVSMPSVVRSFLSVSVKEAMPSESIVMLPVGASKSLSELVS